jgi:hypothetical protein
MVMKRYPNGAYGDFFFMKRAPEPRPEWIRTCRIPHDSGNVIHFPVIDDLASLLWVVNLGCIDLNPWYARCDDVDRPDYLHFDLDPVEKRPKVPFARVREVALILRDALDSIGMPSYAKTTGSRGIHVYVPIVRGPTQKQVWAVAKQIAGDAGGSEAQADHRRVREGEAPAGACARRLQPERVGTNASQHLLGAAAVACARVHARDLARGGRGIRDRRLQDRQRAGTPGRDRRSVEAAEPQARPLPARTGLSMKLGLPIEPPLPPMEATLTDRLPSGEGWQYEPKWDGFRCLAFRNGSSVELQSKSGRSRRAPAAPPAGQGSAPVQVRSGRDQ